MCDKMITVIEMLISSVIKNEAARNEMMIAEYEKLIDALPKGSIICRKKEYYYRKDGKIYDEYIGKNIEKVAEIKEKTEQRKHYEKMLSALRKEQKTILTILEGLE